MRNILVFPDGTEHDFMYPINETVEVGMPLRIDFIDDNVEILSVHRIEKTDTAIYYYLTA